MNRMESICPEMLAGKRMLLFADGGANVGVLAQCFQVAGCEVAVVTSGEKTLPAGIRIFTEHIGCEADVKKLKNLVKSDFGEVDILVLFPGEYIAKPLQESEEVDWRNQVEIPLSLVYLCSRYFSNDMIKNEWGRIIIISAIQAKMGGWNTGGNVSFGTLSAALCGLARSLAVELAPFGITVNSVLPMLDIEDVAHVQQMIPLDILPTVEDVAGAALFFASQGASFITGYGLDINCGLFMD